MNLKTFIQDARINWEDVSIEPDGGPPNYEYPFAITPQDFITFAKADVFAGDVRGLVNGLSNAKRAIDCEADSFIVCLGLKPECLAKQLGDNGLIELNRSGQTKNDSPLKFRLLSALGIATPTIISRMRKLRNILEHEYRRCRRQDVYDAIDVAELFVQACHGRLRSAWQVVTIGSGTTTVRKLEEPEVSVSLSYSSEPSGHFDARMLDLREYSATGKIESKSCLFKPGEKGFVSALILLWQSDINRDLCRELAEFLTELGIPFPSDEFGGKRK